MCQLVFWHTFFIIIRYTFQWKIVHNPVKYFHRIMLRHPSLFSCEAPADSTCLINQKSDKKIYENFSLTLCHTQFIYLSLLRLPSN
jgi:hypothetical protein